MGIFSLVEILYNNLNKGSGIVLPPLVRGKVLLLSCDSVRNGITPACAGKSEFIAPLIAVCQDHPRLRGEKKMPPVVVAQAAGSPPLARGKASFIGLLPVQRGITPACAGKSGQEWGSYWGKRDHPRLRGEKLPRKQLRRQLLGSPPLARGKVCSILKASPYYRITPACAGKRKMEYSTNCGGWDHPRLRGEKHFCAYVQQLVYGSPPLARGKVDRLIFGEP